MGFGNDFTGKNSYQLLHYQTDEYYEEKMIGWKMLNKDLEHHSNNDLIPFLFNLPLNPCGDSDLTNDDQDDDCCCCC